jgi:hypothetical protein
MHVSQNVVMRLRPGARPQRRPVIPARVELLCPGAAVRLLARLRSRSLDGALIGGADPASSPQLAARAVMLGSRRHRRALGEGLARLVAIAQGAPRRWSPLESREAVLANSSELHALASMLHGDTPLYVRGLALLDQLLSDGAGPAYRGDVLALGSALSAVRSALQV